MNLTSTAPAAPSLGTDGATHDLEQARRVLAQAIAAAQPRGDGHQTAPAAMPASPDRTTMSVVPTAPAPSRPVGYEGGVERAAASAPATATPSRVVAQWMVDAAQAEAERSVAEAEGRAEQVQHHARRALADVLEALQMAGAAQSRLDSALVSLEQATARPAAVSVAPA